MIITLRRKLPSVNDTMWKHWRAYAKERDIWYALIRAHLVPRSEAPERKVRIRITSFRNREVDYANLVAGAKPIPDCLVKLKYLKDDKPKYFQCDYYQNIVKGEPYTELEIYEDSSP